MLGASAVVSGSGVAFQGIAEVTAVKIVISKVIVTPPEHTGHIQIFSITDFFKIGFNSNK